MVHDIVLQGGGIVPLQGKISEILIQDGESVQVDGSICRLETDKADMEIVSGFAGTIKWIAHEGDVVKEGEIIAKISSIEEQLVPIINEGIGSSWQKWDLHFHTPSSHDYEYKTATNQEIIDGLVNKGVAVIAITDHHFMDVPRIRELQELGKGKLTVLPGIEFRAELGGSDSIHYIGIFSEKSDIEDIWIKLQSSCEITSKDIEKKGGEEKIHCDLKDTALQIHKLGGLVSVHAGSKSNTLENITNTLPYKMALKTDLVLDHIDILELGQVKDHEAYLNIVFPAIKKTLPMIICSDNHDIRNYVVKENLWIKAEPTFEGLRQILFEPKHRVFIDKNAPISPPIRINTIALNFPNDAEFEGEVFCLSGKHNISLSPNFTCVIGGRGTGKSTFLNLIHEKLKSGHNEFFKTRKIRDAHGSTVSIAESVEIDNDADEKYVEFLSQNEVEDFAKDYQKLTQAVYSRILKRDEKGEIGKKEKELQKHLEAFKQHIVDIKRIETLKNELGQKKKELGTHQSLVDSFSSEEYKALNKVIKGLTGELQKLQSGFEAYSGLLEKLSSLRQEYVQKDPSNQYEEEIDKIVKGIERLTFLSMEMDFTPSQNRIAELINIIAGKTGELKSYLSERGLTEENLTDITNANLMINSLEIEIVKRAKEIEELQKMIDEFNENVIQSASASYQLEIETQIKSISEILEDLKNIAVKPISLSFEFDVEAAQNKVFNDFKILFEGQLSKSNYKGDGVLREILFCVDPMDVDKQQDIIDVIGAHRSNSAAKAFLFDLFSFEPNFRAYKLLCEMAFLDYIAFKKVKVLYDGRPIEKSSFGQRCTAVMVILLLLGNNPIIIDEPEAHLDSLLISNYLVEVIKERKNSRQIVFATHNANFVVNGDAELIHILTIDEKAQITKIQSTTIENEVTRETLIGLEGGIEAFKKRESKYQQRIVS